MTLEGIDFSFARPAPAAIKAAGKAFVVRYVAYPGDGGKGLSGAEAATYHAAGLPIALVFESDAGRAGLGAPAGQLDAGLARLGAILCGQPQDRPIYFAVDWDAQPASFPAIDAYLTAAGAVLGPDRIGVYGGLDVIRHCQSARTARWYWQTYAWSGGATAPGIHLYQWRNGQTLAGGAVDYTRALTDDYGQWPAPAGGDMPLDPNISTPALADFSPGATVYRDAARTQVFAAVWPGGQGIGVVGLDTVNTYGHASPNVCINLYEPDPPHARVLAYVGQDHMTNYRARPPLTADPAAIAAARAEGFTAAKTAAAKAIGSL